MLLVVGRRSSCSMAIGSALLGLWFCLCGWWPLEPSLAQAKDGNEVHVSAPPELVALVPAAAEATVAAGYANDVSEASTTHVTAHMLLSISVVASEGAVTSGHESVLIVGDTRYAWQDWSLWHCNCEEGSMSRVRDITYSMPGVRLDPIQYDVLRFEREVCSYAACGCSREEHRCDRLQVTCEKGPMHICALRDIEQDQEQKKRKFWGRVNDGLKNLWQTMKETFPTEQKAAKAKSKQ